MSQMERAYHLLRPGASNAEIVAFQQIIMGKIAALQRDNSAYFGQLAYRTLGEHLGLSDPYAELKARSNQQAASLVPQIQQMIRQSTEPLLTAMSVAIVGNTMDFGTFHSIDIEREIATFSLSKLGINHFSEFTADFATAKQILMLGDKA